MKFIMAAMMSLFAFSALANESARETVSRIESERNVRCEYVRSSFEVCLGMPREIATCRYTKTYYCESSADAFTLKLKVKEYYSTRTHSREEVVTNIQYL